jgi:hypothetical protein
MTDTFKTCTKCGKEYPRTIEYFYHKKEKKDGLDCWCKVCACEASRKYRETHIESIREYSRQYRAAHPESIRQYQQDTKDAAHERTRKFRKNNAEAIREQRRQLYRENKDAMREQRRQYRQANKEAELERARRYRAANKVTMREKSRLYRKSRPDIARAAHARRRTLKLTAGGSYTAADIALQLKSQKGLCWWCDKPVGKDYHVDHRIPLSKGGNNDPRNLCVSCPRCNLSKSDKLPQEWNGRLL